MDFKGGINAGAITAEFKSDFSNDDPDLLILGYTNFGGSKVDNDQAAAAPGGHATASVKAVERGRVDVIVATGVATDSGRLTVRSGKNVVTDEAITGPVHWVYSVKASK